MTKTLYINLPLDFEQVVDLIKQLPYREKLKLKDILLKDTENKEEKDKILTHYASEDALAKDWMLKEEDEAWKDL